MGRLRLMAQAVVNVHVCHNAAYAVVPRALRAFGRRGRCDDRRGPEGMRHLVQVYFDRHAL